MIKFIKKNHPNVKSVAIVNADDGGVPYLKPLIAKALRENGISVAGDWVAFPNEMVDFSPIASKLAALKADAIFHPNGMDRHVGPILKGLRELGDERWYFYAGVSPCSDIKTLAGAGATKVVSLAPNARGARAILRSLRSSSRDTSRSRSQEQLRSFSKILPPPMCSRRSSRPPRASTRTT